MDDDRAWAKAFYQSRTWRRCRKEFLASKQWLCESCLSKGLLTPAEEAHHKVKLTPENVNDPAIALNHSNLMALCKDCHMEAHRHEVERRYAVGEDGKIYF